MPARSSDAHSASRYSCLQCREAKRKCDLRPKQPNTSTAFSPPLLLSPRNTPSPSQASTQSREAAEPQQPRIQQSTLVAEHFLDPEVFQNAQLLLPALQIDSLLTDEIAATVGTVADIRGTAQKHFSTVHVWMPIVSKIQFYKLLLKRLTYNRAELHLLLLAMRLSSDAVNLMARTPLYELTKQFQHSVQNSGILSLLALQASIFIACYELGHGIYPAAFFSIASCARYAIALSVDSSVSEHPDPEIEAFDLEECRRVWWAILAMDRYEIFDSVHVCWLFIDGGVSRFINLSNPKRQLVTPDPDTSNYIPIDDQNWDNGTTGPEDACTLTSANTLEMGRFARLAQAAHLLSLAIKDVAEGSHDSAQLRRTIFALVHVSRLEARVRRLELCTQMSTCFSAILLLDNPTSLQNVASRELPSHSDTGRSPESSSVLASTIEMAERIIGAHESVKNAVSPFVLHLNYTAASIYLQQAMAEPSSDAAGRVATLRKSLKLFSQRWLVAGK
ncbi:Transcription factor [Cordyceps fumosorosea ARSEF 2679]|uniref:Transcription factor n=1 Tax=Cordyceps fumosorosea (strain ARSEF 2679) TaxID=1081104 RepID=A0A167TIY3_CORFA|nr:Transcription factor [Cordyceps fumosorosea ARSEF 2679]OAA60644.1 Transcription factor [Cordyceps fumosorosea ARSEF 2679]